VSSRWKLGLWIAGGTLAAFVTLLIFAGILISHRSREWLQEWMSQEYHSKVELSSFSVTIPFPLVQTEAGDVTLYFHGRRDLPPLIFIRRLTMRTSMWGLLRGSPWISFVHLEGLQINVPPREESGGTNGASGGANNALRKFRSIRFGEMLSENAVLKILTTKPGKDPLEFDIQQLRLSSSANHDGALAFHALLTNPRPPGQIISDGEFGPWNADTPSETPVSGDYDFENADLSVFPGIAGILSSKGNYRGELDRIEVDGTTETPDFRVAIAGHPVHLSTTFHAFVDGTDGYTYLQPVQARFGQTELTAQGSVEGRKGTKGKAITLEVTATHARIQDLLLLAMKENPSMDGPIRLKTRLSILPGPKPIPQRLNLDGSFELSSVHFTSSAVQQKVDNMSKRSQGKPQEVVKPEDAIKTDDVASAMKGDFGLQDGILSLHGLNYGIPGTNVELAGTYSLEPETLDLSGRLTMQAKLSQTTTGVKSFLLKFADPIFSRGAKGTIVPIKITGPVQHPHYGLDLRHHPAPEKN
jgi:hypothetical protein